MSVKSLYHNVCRTCLTENCYMKPIFNVEEFKGSSIMLHEMLMACASIQIVKGDGLPDQVCMNCAQEMNRAYLFRKLCEKSDATLRHYLNSLLPLSEKVDASVGSIQRSLFISKEEPCQTKIRLPDVESILKEPDRNYFEADKLFQHDIPNLNESDTEISVKNESKEILLGSELNDNEKQKRNYYCKTCNELCVGLLAYRKHITFHKQVFSCELCNKKFKSEVVWTRHKSSHQTEEYLQNSQTKSHKNKTGIIKKRNLPKTCTTCNKTFRFHSNLERHKLIHTGEKPYLCNVCGKGFAQLSYLRIHSFIHTGEKPYKCQTCDKSFAAPGTLVTHVRTHTGERPHICKICGKDFPQSGYLSSHIRTHTGEKPVECKVCHRRFNQRGRLNIHMRTHSGEKPYSCKECGRSFAVKGTLKKHIRTHTGERPYICSVCGQAFAQNGTLATHMRVHRSKQVNNI